MHYYDFRHSLKSFALKHPFLLSLYRLSFGKIKTKFFFGIQMKTLQKRGLPLIAQVVRKLESEGACVFLDCGTLLGFMRDGKPIAWDRDIDLGIYLNDQFSLSDLDTAMKELGLKKSRAFFYQDKPYELSYSNGILNVDFFNHVEHDGFSSVYSFHRFEDRSYPSPKHFTVFISDWTPIESIDYLSVDGTKLPVPSNTDAYIASHYGADWREPNPEWTYWMDNGIRELPGEFGILKD